MAPLHLNYTHLLCHFYRKIRNRKQALFIYLKILRMVLRIIFKSVRKVCSAMCFYPVFILRRLLSISVLPFFLCPSYQNAVIWYPVFLPVFPLLRALIALSLQSPPSARCRRTCLSKARPLARGRRTCLSETRHWRGVGGVSSSIQRGQGIKYCVPNGANLSM